MVSKFRQETAGDNRTEWNQFVYDATWTKGLRMLVTIYSSDPGEQARHQHGLTDHVSVRMHACVVHLGSDTPILYKANLCP